MSVHGPAKDLYESQPTHDSGVTASLDGEVKAFMENLPDSVRSLDATLDPDAPIKFSNPKTKTRRSLPFSAANFWKRLG
ncbi:hypothetical protein SISSUDRAFT_1039567 [Sistotremastrum suecicum HHB10207 ss-3]|uniref:Uncharacterized protein n=1 Tax=Sistotremastrum suecicum HHB10207 ss-3 TaxID=1314776 RepID=A0A166IFC5_9AGAM|nr:hypothetical protein SISSUDRAFT_1039567 [Sistotremastrum suecicum HHB10207 ss-3]